MMSTAFHPQMDGATERANRSIGQILRTIVQPDQTDWVEKLPMVKFAINSKISSSTGFAPFELNYGYMPMFIGGITPIDNTNQVSNNLSTWPLIIWRRLTMQSSRAALLKRIKQINVDRTNPPSPLVIRCTYPLKTSCFPRAD